MKGELSLIAARVVLKALYVARVARMDLMWAVNMLATEVTRWTAACVHRITHMIRPKSARLAIPLLIATSFCFQTLVSQGI